MLKPIMLKEIPAPVTMFNERRIPSKTIPIPSWITADVAEHSNIEKNVRLYYYGVTKLRRKDKRFAKKYKVKYLTMGCIQHADDDPRGYNEIILRKLAENYGSIILKKVREDLYQ